MLILASPFGGIDTAPSPMTSSRASVRLRISIRNELEAIVSKLQIPSGPVKAPESLGQASGTLGIGLQ